MTEPVTIAPESPLTEDGRALVAASEAALRAVYPPEECFSFSAEELAGRDTAFLVARRGGRALGCVALVDMGGYGEIKRLYVAPEARGTGLARRLMAALEAEAARRGLSDLRLETGHALAEAVSLYRSLGYRDCPPFGGYPDIASNLFMAKRLPR